MTQPEFEQADAEAAITAARFAFGVQNRSRLLDQYFADVATINVYDAWKHVYQLLLWTDRTTGLAHCYESDKCQPGRPWYARSLRFHDWLSSEFGVRADELSGKIDWLFSSAIDDLAMAAEGLSAVAAIAAAEQRVPYAGRSFPEPGEDPELISIIVATLSDYLTVNELPTRTRRTLTERVTAHLTNENKRKNLLGEGFEDTIAAILRRVPGLSENYDVHTRRNLDEIPGFNLPPQKQKRRQVDLDLVRQRDGYRTLVTVKWSVRSDREEQFFSEFNDYAHLESLGADFDYVLITNEFDAARLVRACDNRRQNALLFSHVVHVNPHGPTHAYEHGAKGNATTLRQRVRDGRLSSLSDWVERLIREASA
jgi:hypothetical protein